MIATQSPEMSICHFPHPLRGLPYQTAYFLNRLLKSHLSHMCACKGRPSHDSHGAGMKPESCSNCSVFPKQKQRMQGARENSQTVTSNQDPFLVGEDGGARAHSPPLLAHNAARR